MTCILCDKKSKFVINKIHICGSCYNMNNNMIKACNKTMCYDPPTQIVKKLYLGSQNAAINIDELNNRNIKNIIVAGRGLECYFENNIKYLKLDIDDSLEQDLTIYFDAVDKFINDAISKDEGVLVHCVSGISRSASFIIYHLMKSHNKSFTNAYNLVKSNRNMIRPNSNFIKQLKSMN